MTEPTDGMTFNEHLARAMLLGYNDYSPTCRYYIKWGAVGVFGMQRMCCDTLRVLTIDEVMERQRNAKR